MAANKRTVLDDLNNSAASKRNAERHESHGKDDQQSQAASERRNRVVKIAVIVACLVISVLYGVYSAGWFETPASNEASTFGSQGKASQQEVEEFQKAAEQNRIHEEERQRTDPNYRPSGS